MISRFVCTLLLLPGISLPAISQKLKKADKAILENLHTEIEYLANDKLEGRRAGTPGEKLAADFIQAEFQLVLLTALHEDMPIGTV